MGGIEGHYDKDFLPENKAAEPGYDINPLGFYETPNGALEKGYMSYRVRENAPTDPLENKVVKAVFSALHLRVSLNFNSSYRGIFMLRDYDELSLSRSRTGLLPWAKDKYWRELILQLNALSSLDNLTLNFAYYSEVVNNSVEFFTTLAKYGWPINPEEAAKGVDKSLYRNRGRKRGA